MKRISGNPYLVKEDKRLIIDQIPFEEIKKKSSTPFMVFLENRLRENIKSFKEVFDSEFNNFHCFYSFKANYLSEICNIVCSEEIGAEVIGLLELKLALKLGFPPNKILVGGPYLPKDLIESSIKNKVREIIVYNLNDLYKINNIAENYETIQNICIRVRSQKFNSRLGIEFNETSILTLKTILDECRNIKINTILSHYTTQMNNEIQFKKNIDSLVHNIEKLISIGVYIDNINLGGGFPEAATMKEEHLRKMAKFIRKTLEDSGLRYKNIYFEPGRYFVGDTGIFIAQVIQVSEDRWIFLNLGNNICPKFSRSSLRFYNISKIDNSHKYKTSISGIVPTDQDVLAKDYFFTEEIDEDDYVLITNVGAYNITFSNRFPYSLPEILLLKGNSIKQIFDPKTGKDLSLT